MKASQFSDDKSTIVSGAASRTARMVSRDARHAARLALIPGLGQLYNGERAKGILFLLVTFSNLVLLAILLFGGQLLQCLQPLALGLHLKTNWEAARNLQLGEGFIPVVMSYALLLGAFVAFAVRDAYDTALARHRGIDQPRFRLTMPEATSGSYLVHFTFIACGLVLVVFFLAPKPPAEQVTDIHLIKPEPPPPPPPKKEKEPEPPKKVEEPKPVEPKPQPPKPAPKAVAPMPIAVNNPNPSPDADTVPLVPEGAPVSETAAPGTGAPAGAPTGGGEEEIDFSSYMAVVQKRIKKAWFPPRGNESKRITVKFKIRRNGEVGTVRLERSSGVSLADDAAIAAVENAAPFPPLPDGSPDDIDIKFTFDYNIFGGTQSSMREY